jgi:hypothetical protein
MSTAPAARTLDSSAANNTHSIRMARAASRDRAFAVKDFVRHRRLVL